MAESDATEKKSSKRLVIIIGIAVFLLLLIGGAFLDGCCFSLKKQTKTKRCCPVMQPAQLSLRKPHR